MARRATHVHSPLATALSRRRSLASIFMGRNSAVARDEGDRVGESGAGDLRRLVRGIAISVVHVCPQGTHWHRLPCAQECAKLSPMTINQQPTPTKFPIKNGPEIIDFRPVL